ncbi:MAG TPA: aquaporin [Chitinophagaceae bacterium]|nr:aquaporin [Chitinophagaceae bacterium]
MKKYITEFIGTFFLVLAAGSASGDHALLIIASALMVMVYAGGHISGGHYNPCVTLAILIRGRIGASDALVYMISQLAGAIAAAFLVGFFKEIPPQSIVVHDVAKAVVAELLGTFALAYVVLNVATAKGTAGNSFYGLAIGFTVYFAGSLLGSLSGGAFNLAVAVGASVIKAFAWSNIWIYLVGCFGGAALAALVFKMNNPDDK